ncbi:MAG: peptide deformylase [Bacteroidales bacterium]|nr:peptide deformylase [Bacteroidales bacterium]
MKRIALFFLILAAVSCSEGSNKGWTFAEKALIVEPDPVMRVLTIENRKDSLILRTPSTDIAPEAIAAPEYRTLEQKLLATVTSPEQDGVGIAAPQVGLLRRIVAVQRFDKEGEPFEVYPNIRVIRTRGEMAPGGEGCLSVPDRRGQVMRYQDIDISYTSPFTLRDTVETVQGFTAVIFQHETDHLDGVLYIDKLVEE